MKRSHLRLFLQRTLIWAAVPVVLALVLLAVGWWLGTDAGTAPIQYALF